MEKESARKQTLEQLYERRKQVVRLHIAAMGIMKIVELTGLTYPTVRSAIDRSGKVMQGAPERAVGRHQLDGRGRIEGFGEIVLQGHDNPGEDRKKEADQRGAAPGVIAQQAQRVRPGDEGEAAHYS